MFPSPIPPLDGSCRRPAPGLAAPQRPGAPTEALIAGHVYAIVSPGIRAVFLSNFFWDFSSPLKLTHSYSTFFSHAVGVA